MRAQLLFVMWNASALIGKQTNEKYEIADFLYEKMIWL